MDRGGDTGDKRSGRGEVRPRKQWAWTVRILGEIADREAPEPTMLDQLNLHIAGSGWSVGELTLGIVTALT